MSLFAELKRRNVVRVGIAYVLMGWVLLQGADFLLDLAGAPDWVVRSLAVVVVIGLPIALFFAWAFELTPEGIKREADVDRSQSVTPQTGRKLDRAIIVFLALALALVLAERWLPRGSESMPERSAAAGSVPAAPVEKSIAVLPFADLSQAQDQEWFADGLAEEILNALVKTPDLNVASRTSAFQYKGSGKDIATIAGELGVAHVLEGSVRSSGERIRVTAQLIRASDGFHLWSENYDRDVADMISIQEDLASSIARALETTMDPAALAEMAQVGTSSVEAYQAYLRGVQFELAAMGVSEDSSVFQQAYEYFERARQLDPSFAEAHVRASNYWKVELTPTRTDTGNSGLQPREILREYNERIEMAHRTAKSEADRIRTLADQAGVDLRLNEAVRLFLQYLELRPRDEQARSELVTVALMANRLDVARAQLEVFKARDLSDQFATDVYLNYAYQVFDPSEVADHGLAALKLRPNATGLLYQTHRTLLWAERYDEAAALVPRYETLIRGSNPIMQVRDACARGDRLAAEKVLASLEPERNNSVSARWLILNMLGDRQGEIEALKPLEASGAPYQLGSFLTYQQFDARAFPSLVAILEREGIQRPAPVQPPFSCPLPAQPSIAVLPFRDMSPGQDQAWFGEGIAEELLNGLVQLDSLKVASRTSTFALADDGLDIPTLAQRLDVAHVLEGSIRTAGNQVRVTAQLIDVADDKHLWSETFNGTLDDIFKIQDEITAQILAQLEVRLVGAEPASVTEALTSNPDAYRKYLQGRQLWRQRSAASINQAITLFREAVELDPGFHRAWSNLAIAYMNLAGYDADADPEAAIANAELAADRALGIAPGSSEALAVKADLTMRSCRMVEGARLYRQAIRSSDLDPTSRHWYALNLAQFGHLREALQLIREAYEIDPLIAAIGATKGTLELTYGNYERAEQLFADSITLGMFGGDPYYVQLARLLGGASLDQASLVTDLEQVSSDVLRAFVAFKQGAAPVAMLEQAAWELAPANPRVYWTTIELLALAGSPITTEFMAAHGRCDDIPTTIWSEAFRAQRGTAEFFRMMENFGVVEFWREVGWPDDCASLDQGLAECPAP